MASAMVALANITLGSTAATVTFSSIPATYRDLVLVATMTNGNAGNGVAALRYNSDTGTNYTNIGAYGEAPSATGSYSNTVSYQYLSLTSLNATNPTTVKIDILDYATDKHKTLIGRTNYPTENTGMLASRWASTSAITSLNIFLNGTATFAAGNTFTLYGIVS